MILLGASGFLFGVMLAQFLRAWVLAPSIVVAVAGCAVIEFFAGHTVGHLLLAGAWMSVALQAGYFLGFSIAIFGRRRNIVRPFLAGR